MDYYQLEPEVAGRWGENTVVDMSVHPPRVTRLHYEFSGWLGDCIVESFPCFVATAQVLRAILAAGFTGVETVDVEISRSDEFKELYPGRELPPWRWLKPTGTPGKDDFAVTSEAILIASSRALKILRESGLEHCDVSQ